jgi:hypothetical protein
MRQRSPRLGLVAACLLVAACAGPRHGLVERDGRACHMPDVPVPAGYVLTNAVDEDARRPRSLFYESPDATALDEQALHAYFSAELPKHGWTDVAFDAAKGVISARKPAVGQRPEDDVYITTRISVSASGDTRAAMELMNAGSPESIAARSFVISR